MENFEGEISWYGLMELIFLNSENCAHGYSKTFLHRFKISSSKKWQFICTSTISEFIQDELNVGIQSRYGTKIYVFLKWTSFWMGGKFQVF